MEKTMAENVMEKNALPFMGAPVERDVKCPKCGKLLAKQVYYPALGQIPEEGLFCHPTCSK